ncbi:unnamed protein product [Didymodactylos carnosus]|uniref:Fucosyltransferase n=1 Tax=Didymodactylos carnosus TaxID=1234261 RepID=A0A815NVK4_9BILA|nr:unnamed protein product [Didymodactylos carnosus]CAF1439020.1 unnamed protein product [Didymodactylos carnosus]CAF3996109.1 unnamed protein product [Didymodactylos carnosus]CAF4315768.1 unnamed protein product [Didymodactylos carnosus]
MHRTFTRLLTFRSRRRSLLIYVLLSILCTAFIFLTLNHNKQIDKLTIDKLFTTSTLLSKIYPVTHEILPLNKSSTTINVKNSDTLWPLDSLGRSLKTHFIAIDWTGFFGSQAAEGERVFCESSNTTFLWTRNQQQISTCDFIIAHDAQSTPVSQLEISEKKQQYSMVFVMESEVHSSTGNGWASFKFKMTYNLDDSYPEAATYFDMNVHLVDLLHPIIVDFDQKEKSADVVWIISNCAAHNGREGFVQRLMTEMKVDSYGACMKNREGYSGRMAENVEAYRRYKFVIAIENSNCNDYITEKLVKSVASGSIPIVAGRDGKPDYRRYMPKHSFINVFDYSSIKALADDLKRIGSDRQLYESYLWYRKHNKTVDDIRKLPLNEKIKHFEEVVGKNQTMLAQNGIVAKEKSENKVCKLIRFVRETPWKEIAEHNSTGRAGANTACLPSRSILSHFDIK